MKKRTKQQKIRAAEHRQQQLQQPQVMYQYRDAAAEKNTLAPKTSEKISSEKVVQPLTHRQGDIYAHELFAYDVRLIYRDLQKTILLVTGMFVILGVLTKVLGA